MLRSWPLTVNVIFVSIRQALARLARRVETLHLSRPKWKGGIQPRNRPSTRMEKSREARLLVWPVLSSLVRALCFLRPLCGGFFFGVEEALKMSDACGMAQLTECFGLDLANTFPRDVVHLANLFQSAFVTVDQA